MSVAWRLTDQRGDPVVSGLADRAPSAWNLLNELLLAQIADGEFRKARRLAWRAVRSPGLAWTWLNTLARLRRSVGVDEIPYDLARKPGRAFLHRRLAEPCRLQLLTTHYARLLDRLGPMIVGGLLSGVAVDLARIEGRSGRRYHLQMERSFRNAQEGELIVTLFETSAARRLASLSIVLGRLDEGGLEHLWIGGLQGCRGSDSKTATVYATKDLWGLRPRDLLINAAYALRDVFGVVGLRAVSNADHIIPQGVGEGHRNADYDAAWLEWKATPLGDGFYRLPDVCPRRAEQDVPAAKRKLWLSRRALIERIGSGVQGLNNRWRP